MDSRLPFLQPAVAQVRWMARSRTADSDWSRPGPNGATGLTTSTDSDIMRVLLAVDQDGLQSALRLVVEQESGLELVGVVGDAPALHSACAAVLPDLLLVDWDLPGLQHDLRQSDRPGEHAPHPPAESVEHGERRESVRDSARAGLHGERSLRRLYAVAPLLQVIVLGGRPEVRAAAMAAGAHRFVSKTDPPEKLMAALHSIQGSQSADD